MAEQRQSMDQSPSTVEVLAIAMAALLSAGAVVIHLLATPRHFEEWWGYGLFFAAVTLFQGVYAVSLSMRWFWLERFRYYLIAGALVNTLVVALYIMTRTLGVPLVGPLSGEVEHIGLPDLTSKVMETVLVVLLIWLAYQRSSLANEVA